MPIIRRVGAGSRGLRRYVDTWWLAEICAMSRLWSSRAFPRPYMPNPQTLRNQTLTKFLCGKELAKNPAVNGKVHTALVEKLKGMKKGEGFKDAVNAAPRA